MSVRTKRKVNRRLGRAWSAINLLDEGMALPILVQKEEGPSLSLAGLAGIAEVL